MNTNNTSQSILNRDFQQACLHANFKMMNKLYKQGADIDAKGTYFKERPLYTGIFLDDIEIVQWLVHRGADIQKPIFCESPLAMSKRFKCEEIVKYLEQKGAK